jgi:hypothetical protein
MPPSATCPFNRKSPEASNKLFWGSSVYAATCCPFLLTVNSIPLESKGTRLQRSPPELASTNRVNFSKAPSLNTTHASGSCFCCVHPITGNRAAREAMMNEKTALQLFCDSFILNFLSAPTLPRPKIFLSSLGTSCPLTSIGRSYCFASELRDK